MGSAGALFARASSDCIPGGSIKSQLDLKDWRLGGRSGGRLRSGRQLFQPWRVMKLPKEEV